MARGSHVLRRIEPRFHEGALRTVGFDIELTEIRFPTQERWGPSEPLWIIARKPLHAD
jgi:hypothetical protein